MKGSEERTSSASSFCVSLRFYPERLSPGKKPIHAGKLSWGIRSFLCEYMIHAGLVFALREWRKIFLRMIVAYILPNFWGHSVREHAPPVFAPARRKEYIPGELFMYWFRALGYHVMWATCMIQRTNDGKLQDSPDNGLAVLHCTREE